MSSEKVVPLKEGIDFNLLILDMDGQEIPSSDDGPGLRIGDVAVNGLMASMQDDKADGKQKLDRFNLARKIKGKDDELYPALKLNSTKKKLVLEMIDKVYGTLIYARAYEIIEGGTEEDEDEEEG